LLKATSGVAENLGKRDPHLELRHRSGRDEPREKCRHGVLPALTQNSKLEHTDNGGPRVQRVEHVFDERLITHSR
jgi:hypothetical protein